MADISIMASILGILGTACAIIFGYIAFSRNKKQDDNKEGKQNGTILTEIGYIKSGVDDIKRKQEKQDLQHIEVISRLSCVEASAKQAHKRIDRIEGEMDKE
ncbi:hypothetical protein KQI42_09655 [Tissierella sp. MSJ-40]|uniref:Uncharacterized protein n=1 Tax=Tissierella simiarum TaxID=2841534 RepID=A0ABS6E691_9FIRM|nr:hypothetical protein [Tissierella simiarum]MBU5438274.1 hypothetical protein [Tissierella simiarum]